jgi:hypothetical protein
MFTIVSLGYGPINSWLLHHAGLPQDANSSTPIATSATSPHIQLPVQRLAQRPERPLRHQAVVVHVHTGHAR